MTLRQIIDQNNLPLRKSDKAMSFLGNYVRNAIFGEGNPTPFPKVDENNSKVNDYPVELVPHVISLIMEAIKKHPEWNRPMRDRRPR